MIAALIFVPALAAAQGTPADYARANALRARYEALALNVPGAATWSDDSSQFWYRRTVKGGHEFVAFDLATRQRRSPFDHARLAAALSAAIGRSVSAQSLPFNTFTFVNQQKAIEFAVEGTTWRCALTDFECRKAEPRRQPDDAPRLSPDKKWEAIVVNYNVAIRETGIATRTSRCSVSTGPRGTPTTRARSRGRPIRENWLPIA